MVTFLEVEPLSLPTPSIFCTISYPSTTEPKTQCFPSSLIERIIYMHWLLGAMSYHAVLAVQRKNWDPLVLGPALAMDKTPGPVCFRVKFSSANLDTISIMPGSRLAIITLLLHALPYKEKAINNIKYHTVPETMHSLLSID